MQTQCNAEQLPISCVERRRWWRRLTAGTVSSDAGRCCSVGRNEAIGLIDRLAGLFYR